MADRLGHARGLEVDFRIVGAEDVNNPAVIANFLEKFREKGRIRVICVGPDGSERVVYPPPLGGTM